MKITELEKSVLASILIDPELSPVRLAVNFDELRVKDREFTGVGFLTEFQPSPELKLFADNVSLRWGKIGAKLNGSKIQTGYLVYVDDGHVTSIEGYTYGEEWPDQIEKIELYELKDGMELTT